MTPDVYRGRCSADGYNYVQGINQSVLVAMSTTGAEGGTANASHTALARYMGDIFDK